MQHAVFETKEKQITASGGQFAVSSY
jgi:hypothetical protein